MKMIVTVAATPVTSVLPTLSAVDAPSAPRASTAFWTRSTTWYFVSRNPSEPRPCVRSRT